jgi:hypothetical protein
MIKWVSREDQTCTRMNRASDLIHECIPEIHPCHGANGRSGQEWIADNLVGHVCNDGLCKGVGNRCVHNEAFGCYAGLTGVDASRRNTLSRRMLHIGIAANDIGIASAKL